MTGCDGVVVGGGREPIERRHEEYKKAQRTHRCQQTGNHRDGSDGRIIGKGTIVLVAANCRRIISKKW
jgi:hypothetical protein